jgi:DNA helicase II / ATP-dependent DNA helicase PcrA
MTTFQDAYTKLNTNQKIAVDSLEGPVLVVAGPGTGKTQILTLRIANILQNSDVNPENILALTYTENAARNMQERLVQFIGTTAYKVRIGTFHNFCNEVIGTHSEYFAFKKELQQITDLDKFRIIQKLIDNFDLNNAYNGFDIDEKPERPMLRPFGDHYHYQKTILEKIDLLKKEGIDLEEYKKNIEFEIDSLAEITKISTRTNRPTGKWMDKVKLINKNIELFDFYKKYNTELHENGLYDFNDMINFVIDAFENNDELLAYYQERYLYLLVDEYQDTNGAQNKVLNLLANWDSKPNLFAVGDDDQSIFRFQGANIQNILEFKENYPEAKIININENYRSTQKVIDFAAGLIKHNNQRLENSIENLSKNLISRVEHNSNTTISHAEFSRNDIEYNFIAEEIERLINIGTNPDEIAVIYTQHKDGEEILDYLLKRDIPINIKGNSNILDEIIVQQFIALLKAIEIPYQSELLAETLLFDFVNLNRLDSFKINRIYNKNNQSKREIFDLIQDIEYLKENNIESIDELVNFAQKLIEWSRTNQNFTFPQFFEIIMKESGLLDYIQNNHKLDDLNSIKTLYDFAKSRSENKRGYKLADFFEDIRVLQEAGIKLAKEEFKSKSVGVNLMTAFGSKGLEFEYVFIPKLVNGVWGNKRNIDKLKLVSPWSETNKAEDLEEERRLFFVALTRAKHHIYLTNSRKYGEESEFKDKMGSQFLQELDKSNVVAVEAKNYEDKAEDVLLTQLEYFNFNVKEQDYLKSLVDDFVLSVTALNNYLSDPQEFLYNNLLKVPRVKTKTLSLGTAVHSALEKLYTDVKNSKTSDLENIIWVFEKSLNREFLSELELIEVKDEGKAMLKKWFANQKDYFVPPVELEYPFFGSGSVLGDIRLSGKIDKIEWISKEDKTVRVVDYKTGSPKTRGVILKPLDGGKESNLYRQLTFYKLLGEITPTFPYKILESGLEFIKDDKGKYRKDFFEIPDSDVAMLKEIIVEVMGKIRELRF